MTVLWKIIIKKDRQHGGVLKRDVNEVRVKATWQSWKRKFQIEIRNLAREKGVNKLMLQSNLASREKYDIFIYINIISGCQVVNWNKYS